MNVLLKDFDSFETCSDEHDLLDSDDELEDEDDSQEKLGILTSNVGRSIVQDIVYAVSKGKKLTPKNIGLALTVHQATRSKKLVHLLNAAGHCMTYKNVFQADCTLASLSLKSFDEVTGAVYPPNVKPFSDFTDESYELILHVTADNVDIIIDTLDGKETFHGTQMVAFQRKGAETSHLLKDICLAKQTILQIPKQLYELPLVPYFPKQEPHFGEPEDAFWYDGSNPFNYEEMPKALRDSRVEELAFVISRAES